MSPLTSGFLSPEPYAVILRYIAKANEEPSRRSFFLTLEAFDAASYSGLPHGDVQRPKQRREQLLRYIARANEEPSRRSVSVPLYEPGLRCPSPLTLGFRLHRC